MAGWRRKREKTVTRRAAPDLHAIIPEVEDRKVLVVEDDRNIRELVCLHLGLEGYDCTPVADGKEAMALASDKRFDLIILDLMLPNMDGVTICRAVRRAGPNRDAPILMLTARREEADKVMEIGGRGRYKTVLARFDGRTAARRGKDGTVRSIRRGDTGDGMASTRRRDAWRSSR